MGPVAEHGGTPGSPVRPLLAGEGAARLPQEPAEVSAIRPSLSQ
jgi:hypothetical protein